MSSPFQQSFNSKSPLNSSSPDRVLGERDIQRKLNKADRKFKKLKGDGSRRDIRKLEAGMLAQEQAERKRSGGVRGEAPFFQHGPPHPKGPKKPVQKWSKEKCDAKRKELKEVLAKDPYAEFGSILKEQIAKHC